MKPSEIFKDVLFTIDKVYQAIEDINNKIRDTKQNIQRCTDKYESKRLEYKENKSKLIEYAFQKVCKII